MGVLLILCPVLQPGIVVLEVVRTLRKSRNEFSLQRQLIGVVPRGACVDVFHEILGPPGRYSDFIFADGVSLTLRWLLEC